MACKAACCSVCGTNHNFAISKPNAHFQCAEKEEIGPRGCFHLVFTCISSLITNGQRMQREHIQIRSLTLLLECQRQGCWLDCSSGFTGRQSKPSCNHRFGCFILEELDYLFNLTSLEVPAHATGPGSSKDTNKTENQRRLSGRVRRVQKSVTTYVPSFPLWSAYFCLTLHLLSLPLA